MLRSGGCRRRVGRRGGGRGAGGLGIGGLDSASGGDDWLVTIMGVGAGHGDTVCVLSGTQLLVNDMLAVSLKAPYIWLNVCQESLFECCAHKKDDRNTRHRGFPIDFSGTTLMLSSVAWKAGDNARLTPCASWFCGFISRRTSDLSTIYSRYQQPIPRLSNNRVICIWGSIQD